MFVFALFHLLACDDTLFPAGGEPVEGVGWCGIENLIQSECLTCHSAASALGGLDLETDPAAILTRNSTPTGLPFIVAGSPDESFFYRKLAGDLAAGEGGIMPPTGAIDPAALDNVATWITDGATIEPDCGGGAAQARFHAIGWADPDVHGTAAKLSELSCVSCHGADLTGGVGPSCDSCHGSPEPSDAWRTDCSFCHGERGVGPTPPRQIDGSLTSEGATFPAHQAHSGSQVVFSSPYGCDTCHVYPESATSPGHVLVDDDTPGVAEVGFASDSWDGSSCTTSCHGASPVLATDTVVCGSCHGSPDAPAGLGGEHAEHVTSGVGCEECHDTVNAAGEIVILNQHVKGSVDIALPAEVSQAANGSCTGTCHNEAHAGANW